MFGIEQVDSEWLIVLGLVSVVTFVLSLLIIPVIIVRIPEDYFTRDKRDSIEWKSKHPALRLCLAVLKNMVGLVLLMIGILMLVLPGQGLLTMLFGIALLDFPGKHTVERRIISQPKILNSINWIRKKAHKNPLLVD